MCFGWPGVPPEELVDVQPTSVTWMVSDSDVCGICQQTGGDPSEEHHYLPAGPPAVCFRD